MTLRAQTRRRSPTPAPRPDAMQRLAGRREPQRWPLRGTPASRAQGYHAEANTGVAGLDVGVAYEVDAG
ncbi:hypothetical protein A9Q02_19240 [Candidatus Chloroploca asiatica]|uniref:Uncharacterized protein n=1 Tax=Candidatus Chloroploca asiatica TaxID=1506545 RepID=A0A2H3KTC9_9CHLR|nr:hypothetical protein A9Q02_19240 [Candidatus Chloroploca asiatica]